MKKHTRLLAFLSSLIFMFPIFESLHITASATELDTIIECESLDLVSGSLVKDSLSASGGRYVAFKNYTTIAPTTGEMTFYLDLDEGSEITSFIRLYTPDRGVRVGPFTPPYAGGSTFYYRWDNGTWLSKTVYSEGDFVWVKLDEAKAFDSGRHKLEISHKSSDLMYDCIYFGKNVDKDFVPQNPEGVIKYTTQEQEQVPIIQEQKEIPTYSGEGILFEAEDLQLVKDMEIIKDSQLSKGRGVFMKFQNQFTNESAVVPLPPTGTVGAMEVRFIADVDATYNTYVRTLMPDTGADSLYATVQDEPYVSTVGGASANYKWIKVPVAQTLKAGEMGVTRFYPRESGLTFDQVVVTRHKVIPSGIVEEVTTDIKLTSLYEEPPLYYPPENVHPRLMFREEDLPRLRENLTHEQNERFYNKFKASLEKDITNINPVTVADVPIDDMRAKLYNYALFKNADGAKKGARDVIELLLRSTDVTWTENEVHRQPGHLIVTAAYAYDWAYDLLTKEEKNELINACIMWSSQMEEGWPPRGNDVWGGHGAECMNLRSNLSFAIAVADERPDIYEYIGALMYHGYIPVREYYLKGHMNYEGSDYGPYRHVYDMYLWWLLTAMGAPEPYSVDDLGLVSVNMDLYNLRSDGSPLFDGDCGDTLMELQRNWSSEFFAANISKNPYLKYLYETNSRYIGIIDNGDALAEGLGTLDTVSCLIINDVDLESKPYDELPLSTYMPSPVGSMVARTGWGQGVNDKSVVAQMKVYEINGGGHQHRDSGTFQIYYQGPLLSESGHYAVMSDKQQTYIRETVAHNGLLIFDPDEPEVGGVKTLYGGQKWQGQALGASHDSYYEKIRTMDERKKADVAGYEIDPKNLQKPEYTYIKGDITDAYTDKVSDVKRSMMFLNLFDEEVPAAMVVFDKVTSKKPSFEKKWVLHTQTAPETKDGQTIAYASETVTEWGEGFKGKVVVDHLLPAPENTDIEVIGGPEEGWQILNGEYLPTSCPKKDDPSAEANTYRMEISPKNESETDYFLNVIQVTDSETNGYEKVEMLENDNLYGISIMDRVVYFSKSGNREEIFEIDEPSIEGIKKYTFCDAQEGEWLVTIGNETQTISVTKDGGVLAFDAAGGKISAKKIKDLSEEELKNNINELFEMQMGRIKNPDADDTVTNYLVEYNKNYVKLPISPVIKNGKLMVPLERLAEIMQLDVKRDITKISVECPQQNMSATLKLNSNEMITDSEKITFNNPVYNNNGYLMVELRPFAEYFNHEVWWDDWNNIVHLVPHRVIPYVLPEGYIIPADIKYERDTYTNEELNPWAAFDGFLNTMWSCSTRGKYIDFIFDEEHIFENIEIIFNYGGPRTPFFELHQSKDGVNYEKFYEGVGMLEPDGINFETFKFDVEEEIKTKYIRLVAKGTSTGSFFVPKEIRFKEGEKLIRFESPANMINIVNVNDDGGEIDPTAAARFITDNNSKTNWATNGTNRYVQFDFEKEESLDAVEVIFNPAYNRTAKFDIQTSIDGVNFETIYSGTSDKSVTAKDVWQTYKLNGQKAKYVRYVGQGSDKNNWNGVIEIRFIKK